MVGQAFETVYIPEEDRGTLCISSQVGCVLDCSFCSTAQQGFNRNLDTAEIVGQVWLANRELGYSPDGDRVITNVASITVSNGTFAKSQDGKLYQYLGAILRGLKREQEAHDTLLQGWRKDCGTLPSVPEVQPLLSARSMKRKTLKN